MAGIRYSNIVPVQEINTFSFLVDGVLAAKAEPGFLRRLAFRNRDECRRAGLRRQQIVTRFVEFSGGDIVADRQQIPALVHEHAETHLIGEALAGGGHRFESMGNLFQPRTASGEGFAQAPGEEGHVTGRLGCAFKCLQRASIRT